MTAGNGSSTGAHPVGSAGARRQAALVLEALGGLRSAQEAADAMEVAIARYYVLERRAVQAVVAAMEPRPRGRQRTLRSELEAAQREIERLEREVLRYQALHRAASRAIGVPPEEGAAVGSRRKKKTVRARRRKSRAEKVLPRLGLEDPGSPAPASSADSDAPAPNGQEVDDASR